ncbi:HCL656Cp [Eremothecium sinecaudum]|uniref:protein disulfide-isomerase n=1 Tax=Eremothecium sinecaudum TaxID=45286 RepID=A0A109UVU4_9SACH|nr:HCL656Cp [Eremothecium sinecaudum]AMD19495.1 HCL656Cp [Eremothecium sinecaudum]
MLFKKQITLALVAAVTVGASSAQNATAPDDSDVVQLNGETFQKFVDENPLVLAEFYAPWCGYCKSLAPEYVQAAAELKDKGIPLAQVDCTKDQQLCMEMEIRGYPSLRIFKDGKTDDSLEYKGGRTKDDIVKFMVKQNEPAVLVLNEKTAAEDLKKVLKEAGSAVIVDGGVKGFNSTFYEVAGSQRTFFTFVQNQNGDGKLKIYLQGEEDPIVYDGEDLDVQHFTEWIAVQSVPFFGDVDADTYERYLAAQVPMAYFFYTSKEERAEWEPTYKKLAKQYRGLINFVGLDTARFGKHADALNMKQQFPLFVIHDFRNDSKFGMPQLTEEEFKAAGQKETLKEKDVSKFVKDFLDNKLEPIVKSEDIPETQLTNVYKLVGKTHQELVHDPTKDVLVEYYAPWCGHCKRLAPTYEQLADVYASDEDAKDKVLIANIDFTENDVSGVHVEGFPTIVLYPAGKDSEPQYYDSTRSLESFFDFILEKGNNKIDGKAIKERLDNAEALDEDEEVEIEEPAVPEPEEEDVKITVTKNEEDDEQDAENSDDGEYKWSADEL